MMSTKVSIAWNEPIEGEPSFLLYEDVLDLLGATDTDSSPLYLRLVGVSVELETLANGGAALTMVLPRKLAGELGLLQLRRGAAGGPGARSAE
jgi:hypothetical protein